MLKLLILAALLLIQISEVTPQTWPKLYGASVHKGGLKIHEAYDKGYKIAGTFIHPGGEGYMGFIMKTDINGDILWEKHIGESGYIYGLRASRLTSDGGIIFSGFSTRFGTFYDPWVMKLNACGEEEWCKIFHVPDLLNGAWDVLELPSGNILVLINIYSYDIANERIWLINMSPQGEVIWEKLYCQSPDKGYNNEIGYYLMPTSDGNILLTGECLVEYPANSNWWWWYTLHIMVDTTGEELWAKPFRQHDIINHSTATRRSVEDMHGNFYTAGLREAHPDYDRSGGMSKIDKDGNDIDWIPVIPDHQHHSSAIVNTVIYDTNHFVLTGSYRYSNQLSHIMLYKTDTLGNILHEKELYRDDNGIQHATLTSDNHVIMTSLHMTYNPVRWKVYINKVDGELNEAEFDPRQLTYDSLCPYPIVTDTIVPDCDIILGHRPPELTDKQKTQQLEVYPNPASAYTTIKLPETLSRSGHNGFMAHTTVWHHWIKDASLQVFNIHGQQTHTQHIPDGQQELQLNVSAWPPGIYLLRVKAMNGITVDGKMMVIK